MAGVHQQPDQSKYLAEVKLTCKLEEFSEISSLDLDIGHINGKEKEREREHQHCSLLSFPPGRGIVNIQQVRTFTL